MSDLPSSLNQAIDLINARKYAEARAILVPLSEQYPNVEQIWLWLSAASENDAERIANLRHVLEINPRNGKARAALTRLTGEALPPLPPDPARPKPTARTMEVYLTAGLGLIALLLVLFLINAVVGPLLAPKPTATSTPTPSITFTPSMTYTATITPGGPTFTPIEQTLPPSWTPMVSPTLGPTSTRPTSTPPPTQKPSATFTVGPTRTSVPTITPGGPSLTPLPTDTPITTPTTPPATQPATPPARTTATVPATQAR